MKNFIREIKVFVPVIIYLLVLFTVWVCSGKSYSELLGGLLR